MEQEKREDLRHLLSATVYGIMAMNTIASIVTTDMIDELSEDEKIYRFGIKRHCGIIEKEIHRLNKEISERLNDKHYVFVASDFGMMLYEALEKDIEKLKWSIAQVFTKHKEEDAIRKSNIMTSVALVDLAVSYAADNVKKIGSRTISLGGGKILDIAKTIKPLRMDVVAHSLKCIKDELCDKSSNDIDLNNDKNCSLAVDIILNKLENYELLMSVLNKATKKNS